MLSVQAIKSKHHLRIMESASEQSVVYETQKSSTATQCMTTFTRDNEMWQAGYLLWETPSYSQSQTDHVTWNTAGISFWIYRNFLQKSDFSTIRCQHIGSHQFQNHQVMQYYSTFAILFPVVIFDNLLWYLQTSSYSCIEVNNKHRVCLPSVMA